MSNTDPTRTLRVPSAHVGVSDAELRIFTADGECARMALVSADGVTLAEADDFRVAECGRWTWLDMPSTDVLGTFGSFLGAAWEGINAQNPDATDGWHHITAESETWADALAILAEYPACETCGEPSDYCAGHGVIA